MIIADFEEVVSSDDYTREFHLDGRVVLRLWETSQAEHAWAVWTVDPEELIVNGHRDDAETAELDGKREAVNVLGDVLKSEANVATRPRRRKGRNS